MFLSHNWGTDREGRNNHQRVSRLNADLQRAGLVTWFDEERLQGNIIDQIADGIDESACVVVCITRNYIERVAGINSPNDTLKREFEYAGRKKGPTKQLLPLVMEQDCLDSKKWTGSVGFELGQELYVNLSDDGRWETKVESVVERVKSCFF